MTYAGMTLDQLAAAQKADDVARMKRALAAAPTERERMRARLAVRASFLEGCYDPDDDR